LTDPGEHAHPSCPLWGEEIAGIVTERDYLRRIPLEGRCSQATRVDESMTKDIVHIEPSREQEIHIRYLTDSISGEYPG
jgi:hypothetical protein